MHRQSLGSPASKLHSNNTLLFTGAITTDTINSEKSPSSSSSTIDDEQHKLQKPYHHKLTISFSSTSLIHLIPILTFLCFLILYLSSHDPSRTDLAQFNGFTAFASKKIVIDDVDNGEKNEVLEIRSMRNLQQEERRRFRHRKFGQ